MYVYIHAYMHAYMHKHTRTHTHTLSLSLSHTLKPHEHAIKTHYSIENTFYAELILYRTQ